MFEKWFAKYARAVSDGREREYLFKKYKTKTVVSIIFYALCFIVIALAIFLEEYIGQDWALIMMTVAIFGWIGFAIANLCLWISFKKMYNAILKRPADSNEMPEITSYRQKSVQDKKSAFKSLWWAWLVFGVCVAAFAACVIMETIKNPDGEEFGVWGGVAVGALLIGAFTLIFAYTFYNVSKQQKGKSFEQQTESEAQAIDAAQGRMHEYTVQADSNLQSYRYLFPNRELYDSAETIRQKNTKLITRATVAFIIIALAATILFLCSERLGQNLVGYALPAAMTLLFVGIVSVSIPLNRKLKRIENEQKKELETNPDYSLNLQWYRLYLDFGKFKGKIYLIFFYVSLVLGWVLAALFPETVWSLLSIAPMLVGLLINSFLVKDLRRKAIPIEREIDKKTLLMLHDVRFVVKDGETDEEMLVSFDGDGLMPQGKARGGVTLYLGETYICMEVDKGNRVVNFSSGQMRLSDTPYMEIPSPESVRDGAMYAELDTPLSDGTCRRIKFDGGEGYDDKTKNYIVGNRDEKLPWHRIFKNAYVQLSEENVLQCALFTDIEDTQEK